MRNSIVHNFNHRITFISRIYIIKAIISFTRGRFRDNIHTYLLLVDILCCYVLELIGHSIGSTFIFTKLQSVIAFISVSAGKFYLVDNYVWLSFHNFPA